MLKLQLGATARGVPAGVCHRLLCLLVPALQPGTLGSGWGRSAVTSEPGCWWQMEGPGPRLAGRRANQGSGVEAGPTRALSHRELRLSAEQPRGFLRWRRRRWTQGQGGATL